MVTASFPETVTRPRWRDEGWFLVGLGAIALAGLWCRVRGLSHGSLYRDDAWVALTSRVPWHDAWRMVGTAPGFVLFERFWVALTSPSTWWAQIPTLALSIVAIVVVGMVARYFGLRRSTALLAAALIAVSRIDIQYATHLKPYASDVIAGALVLAAGEYWRRGHSGWPFGIASLLSLVISFSVAPVVLGCALVMAVEAAKQKRVTSLVGPGLVTAVPVGALYLRVRAGISPQLKRSWSANFFSFHSLHDLVHSARTILDGLIWGFSDTTPHWHVPGLSKFIIVFVVIAVLIGASRFRSTLLPLTSVVVAFLFAAGQLAPLGTGRTDAYLYPALALLACSGVESTVRFLHTHVALLGRAALVGVVGLVGFLFLDSAAHRPVYPGGNIAPVEQAVAATTKNNGGGVIIEGTARWPWTYYAVSPVTLRFSNLYNTGFAPVSNEKDVVIMPGTVLEGGYNPTATVRAIASYCTVLYVRTDDWPTLGDPLRTALSAANYHLVSLVHPAGYLMETLTRPCAKN